MRVHRDRVMILYSKGSSSQEVRSEIQGMSESTSQDHDLARLDSGFLNLKLQPQNRAGRQTWFALPHSPTATIATGTIGEVLNPLVPKLFDQNYTQTCLQITSGRLSVSLGL